MAETVSAKVQRVLFPKTPIPAGRRTWCILKCDIGVAKGCLSWHPEANESITLSGEWAQSKYSGMLEFCFTDAKRYIPMDERDALKYACLRTKGLGPAAERAIWDAFGAGWRTADLSGVKGVGPGAIAALRDTLARMTVESDATAAVAFLVGKGATPHMAEAAFARWKSATIPTVSANPYVLADLDGYGFADVDGHISAGFGIAPGDPRRTDAAILYCVRRLTRESTIAEWTELCASVLETIDTDAATVAARVKALFASGALVGIPLANGIATAKDYAAEKAIYDFMTEGGAE